MAAISSGMTFVLLALAVPAADRLPELSAPPPAIAQQPFDLAAVTLMQPQIGATSGHDPRMPRPLFDPSELAGTAWSPPRKTWGSANRGPVIQIGALGSKDKRIPDLAHLSLDWDF